MYEPTINYTDLHGTTRFSEGPVPDYGHARNGTCRYCSAPIRVSYVVCGDCKHIYLEYRKKAKAQAHHLVELARERRGEPMCSPTEAQ